MSMTARTFARRVRRRIRRKRSYLVRFKNLLGRVWSFLRQRLGIAVPFFISVGCASAFATVDGGWRLGLVFAALASLLSAQAIARTPYSHESGPYAFLPMPDAEILRRVALGRVYHNRWWLLLLPIWFVVMMLGAVGRPESAAEWIASGLAGAGQLVLAFALAAIWLAYAPKLRFHRHLALGVACCMLALLFGSRALAQPLAPAAEWLLLAIPTGWVAGAWMAWHETRTVSPVVYGALAVAAIGGLPWAYARIRAGFAIRELEFYGTHLVSAVWMEGQRPWDLPLDPEDKTRQEEPPVPLPAEDEDNGLAQITSPEAVRYALLGVTDEYRGGPLVRLAFGRFDARQRVIAGLLMGTGSARDLEWEQSYLRAARWLLGLLAVVCLLPDQAMRPWIAFGPIAFVSFLAMPVLGGLWEGVNRVGESLGVKTLPIGYRELARIMLRLNRVRLLAWLPLALAACAVAGWKLGVGPETGLIVGGKVAIVVLALQPAFVMFQIQQSTKDGGGFWGALGMAAIGVAVVGGGLAAGVALFQTDPRIAAAGAVGIFIAGELLYFFGRRRYEHGPIDIESQPAVQQYWR